MPLFPFSSKNTKNINNVILVKELLLLIVIIIFNNSLFCIMSTVMMFQNEETLSAGQCTSGDGCTPGGGH